MLIAIELSDLLYYKLSRFNLCLLHSIHHGIKWSSLLDISDSFLRSLFESTIFQTQERTDPMGQQVLNDTLALLQSQGEPH